VPTIRSTPDIVFGPAHVAVYVDGCFWHSCPDHATQPAANADWWRRKLDGNVARDRRTNEALIAAGWQVVRVWEHEETNAAADRVEAVVRAARERPSRVRL
jgi:DNA mismatch endonuclease, patch repair protein